MRGDQLALSALADRCVRFNRLRIQGEAPRERPDAVAASCRLLDFTLRPLLGDTRHGDAGQDYLRVARELTAMTGSGPSCATPGSCVPSALVDAWPGAEDGRPARIGRARTARGSATCWPWPLRSGGLVGDVVTAARRSGRR